MNSNRHSRNGADITADNMTDSPAHDSCSQPEPEPEPGRTEGCWPYGTEHELLKSAARAEHRGADMTEEFPTGECVWCGDREGPDFVRTMFPQFSASGARPDITVTLCEACAGTKLEYYVKRYTDGH